jgi:hypothetical protein
MLLLFFCFILCFLVLVETLTKVPDVDIYDYLVPPSSSIKLQYVPPSPAVQIEKLSLPPSAPHPAFSPPLF